MKTKMAIQIIVISLLIGVLNELILAHWLQLWMYMPWWLTFINWILMFGIVMPIIAMMGFSSSLWFTYFLGTIIGWAYEFLDQFFLHWAFFPNHEFVGLHNIIMIRLVIGLIWGFVPLVNVIVMRRCQTNSTREKTNEA